MARPSVLVTYGDWPAWRDAMKANQLEAIGFREGQQMNDKTLEAALMGRMKAATIATIEDGETPGKWESMSRDPSLWDDCMHAFNVHGIDADPEGLFCAVMWELLDEGIIGDDELW